jgi:DNA-binding NarL/FixJ family response regulator
MITFFCECSLKTDSIEVNTDLKYGRLAPSVLLLTDDQALADFVLGVVKPPWELVSHRVNKPVTREVFVQPNVRLVILDDQAVEEKDRGRLLAQINKHFSGTALLYVAGSQSDGNERRARTNGAHYYVSKPLSLERLGHVLQSFLQVQRVDGRSTRSAHSMEAKSMETAKESRVESLARVGAAIRSFSEELNREDSHLRSRLLDAALAGLRLERNPESAELRRDAAQVWAAIEPILSHHLDAEDNQLLPWLEQQGGLSPEAVRKVRAYHDRLRTLVGAVTNAGAEHLTEAQAREVGRALRGLAVNLDDAIDDEQRRLFPTIRKALFEIDHRG